MKCIKQVLQMEFGWKRLKRSPQTGKLGQKKTEFEFRAQFTEVLFPFLLGSPEKKLFANRSLYPSKLFHRSDKLLILFWDLGQ